MLVLGIETSCDETAAAIVDSEGEICANLVLSQFADHAPYGGVVPEIAARSHIDHLDGLVRRALAEADLDFAALDGVAATAGPGLIGGVMVGLMTAKAIAAVHGLAFAAVNHLEAHALSARLVEPVPFPYLLLLISGGHCQLLIVEGVDRYRRLGTTLDDALGEAFDKAARCLGLGYPGGPALERVALNGNAESYTLPRPMLGRPGCDFSFSGLKTALARQVDSFGHEPDATEIADLAAAFQETVAVVLEDRLHNAAARFRGSGDTLVVAGGVAANRYLRTRLGEVAEAFSLHLVAPPTALCTDNGAMVAWAGIERLRMGLADDLASPARARWPLDDAAPPVLGAGVKA